ncbi:endolytic transglycosylase MltG [Consotaella salsifontis]|uniref:endolytic transglycosylase MltG n=1 Tax=Consotaella salsifontis TaxID=1365950 RepID=UPI001FD9A5AD|nr:endolytic transglycosylase MltG [Consotaella salsifontis]
MRQEPAEAETQPPSRKGRRAKPPRPKRRSRYLRNNGLIIFLSFLLTVGLVAALGAAGFYAMFEGRGPLRQETTYLIARNSGVTTIAEGLEEAGIIRDARVFQLGTRLSGAGGQLKAGEYAFAPGESMREVMEKLKSGKSILHSLTVPEGRTVQQVYDLVKAEPTLSGDLPPLAPEGSLRPETYRFTRGMSRGELIDTMAKAQERLVKEVWEERDPDLPVKDINEFVTLASIVERETGVDGERPKVAAVFVNRLRKKMRLQSDPTVIYGIWGGAGKPSDEPIRQSHLKDDNPYNTYVNGGLPPGPIANPGRAALEAVAHPAKTSDLYFVADGTGGHVFSATLEEHNANVRHYREILRQQGAEPADEASGQ